MTLAITNLTSGHNQGSPISSGVTASISPAANSLLILAVGGFDGTTSQDFTVSAVSGFGATWTRQKLSVAGSTPKGDVEAWTAPMGGSPGSGTITITLSGSVTGGIAWAVDQATGQNTSTPVVTSNTVAANNSSTASSVTYATAASAGNLFWFMCAALLGTGGSGTQSPSETPAWTELADVQSDTTSVNGVNVETQVSTDATHLTGSSTLSVSHSWGTVGLEIAVAAAGPPSPSLLMASFP